MITVPSRFAAVCALLFTACFAGAAPASATVPGKGSDGYCPDASGVTVVVDFGDLGPQPLIRCAPGTPANGVAALQDAGVEIAGSQKYGFAVACRIEGKPGPDVESCAGMPSATAYWSYWHAAPGGAWESSQEGAQTSKPASGGFEGWAFAHPKSANDLPAPPRVAPVRQAVSTPAPAPAAASSSFPWGLIIGIVAIVLVGGAAFVVARRRRRAQ
jgi:LPXTG-motif cell wall-anchored protein